MESLTAQLQIIDKKIPHINAGGCGKFALLLGKKFKQNNIKFKYILLDVRYSTTLKNLREFVPVKT